MQQCNAGVATQCFHIHILSHHVSKNFHQGQWTNCGLTGSSRDADALWIQLSAPTPPTAVGWFRMEFPTHSSLMLILVVDEISPSAITSRRSGDLGVWSITHKHNSAASHTFTINKQCLRADRWRPIVNPQWLKLLCGTLINNEPWCSALTDHVVKV